jgi:di/tricarboxylate transporter
MNHIAITAVILLAAIGLFVWNKLPIGLVAIGVALALAFTGVITFGESLGGFGDPVIVFIAALFVVSEALDATGVTTWAGEKLLARAGSRPRRLLTYVMLLVAVVTALISVNGAVAALIPMVVVLAIRTQQQPSQMLMPLAFGAHAGSLLVLTGTPVNLLVSEFAEKSTGRPIGFFAFGLVGLPLLAGTILVTILLGPRLLPRRSPKTVPRDLSDHATTLAHLYSLANPGTLLTREKGVTELVVPPRSPFIGDAVFPGMVTDSGDLVVLAIHRSGEEIVDAVLAPGDVVLLRGTWDNLDKHLGAADVLTVDTPASIRRQAVPMGRQGVTALVILGCMVVLLATGVVPAAIAALLAAAAMVLFKVVSVGEAHRSISWTTLILVAGMIPLSTAIQASGAADLVAHSLVDLVGGSSPYLLIFGIALVTVVLGQLISNMATALIVAPIAIALAAETHISPLPLLLAVSVCSAASFLTPVATPANTMVLAPGAYRFGDYWKLGLPLLIFFVLVATFLVPIFWPF